MNFKTQIAVASLALGLASGAHAAIATPGNSGEFVFSAWGNGYGYTFDLYDEGFADVLGSNVLMNSLIGTQFNVGAVPDSPAGVTVSGGFKAGDVVFDMALPGFDTFLSNAGSSDAVMWNLISLDLSGIRRLIQTVAQTPTSMISDAALINSANAMDFYNAAANTAMVDMGAADSYALTDSNQGTAYAGTVGGNFGGKGGFFNAASLDTEMDLYVLRSRGTTPVVNNVGAFGQLLGDDGNGLTAKVYLSDAGAYHLQLAVAVAPVPEPETYAMLLAGLGLVGFMARRRKLV